MGEMDDIEAFARGNRRKRNIRLSIIGLICASPFLWLTYTCQKQRARNAEIREEARARDMLTPEEQAEIAKLLPEIGKSIQSASKAFVEDLTLPKIAEVVPGDEPCGRRTAVSGYLFVKPGEAPKPQQLEAAARSLADLEERIKTREDGPERYDLEYARDLANRLDDTVFVVGERTEPVMLGDSFIPGQVRGTAYVYSARARKIVCAGHFEAQNSSEIAFEYTTSKYDYTGEGNKRSAAQGKLEGDLASATNKAIANALRQARIP